MIQLLNKFDKKKIIHAGNYNNIKECVEFCAKNDISMECADLQDADLRGVDLIGADLRDAVLYNANLIEADLAGADLAGANLRGVDLSDANLTASILSCANLMRADLSGSNLSRSNLTGSNLTGADLTNANLTNANLTNAKLDFFIENGLLEKIAEIVVNNPDKLDMEDWHSECGTAHCIAGWAVELSENGKELEEKFGTEIAGCLLLGSDASSRFYDSNRDALEYLRSVLNK